MCNFHRCLGLAFLVAMAGCASNATITSTWSAPNPPQLTNVVTLSPVKDAGLRHMAEDQLAQQLSQHGVRAVPGYTVVSDQDLSNQNGIVAALRAKGFDGVVAMRLVDARQQLQYYPGFDAYWGGVWGPYGGAVVPETVVRIEVNAYSLATKQLVFSATSKSIDPNSARQLIGSVSKVTTDRLAQDRVIGPTQATMQ
jgi:hypothetical protein